MTTLLYILGIKLPKGSSLSRELKMRMSRSYYRNNGRRALKTSLGLQIFGYPFILEMLAG